MFNKVMFTFQLVQQLQLLDLLSYCFCALIFLSEITVKTADPSPLESVAVSEAEPL